MSPQPWSFRVAKRVMDVTGAAAGLAVLSPVIAVVAIAVRIGLGRPVLLRQERAGLGGQPIAVPKFRTMTDDRDEHGELLPDADRLTPLGSKLRSLSLDELPQLWSVLKGDMSLVGPRPLPVKYVARYSPQQRRRLDVKPGVTGLAQVRGRNALSWPEKLALDVQYVEQASILLDLKIIGSTVRAVVRREGVAADGHVTMPEFMGER